MPARHTVSMLKCQSIVKNNFLWSSMARKKNHSTSLKRKWWAAKREGPTVWGRQVTRWWSLLLFHKACRALCTPGTTQNEIEQVGGKKICSIKKLTRCQTRSRSKVALDFVPVHRYLTWYSSTTENVYSCRAITWSQFLQTSEIDKSKWERAKTNQDKTQHHLRGPWWRDGSGDSRSYVTISSPSSSSVALLLISTKSLWWQWAHPR